MHYEEGPVTEFVKLLREAFPQHAYLPERCPISLALEVNQNDFSDVVEVVSRCGERAPLIERLRATHPRDACHREQFDGRFWNVWTEACAFAWAVEVARFDCARFTDDTGKPDLIVDSQTWLEAKTIETSPKETRTLERMAELSDRANLPVSRGPCSPSPPHPNLIKKFHDGLKDALAKRDRQGVGGIIVFFCLAGIDWPTDRDAAYRAIRAWARDAGAKSGTRVVISERANWNDPFVDTDTWAV